ncbi:MAG: aldo/keto reductase [Tagaea sp.]|nr:aldo/keto reductase [Tagaea sp.]
MKGLDRTTKLPDGEAVAQFGLGTWRMGESKAKAAAELAALRAGLDKGVRLIDTAEMYGEGGAEEILGQALAGRRDEVFVVSKVYPHNASRRGVAEACARSLKRLKTDRIDLYLLHWRGNHPLAETVAGFEALKKAGQIRHWGVSNFDTPDMDDLIAAGGDACAANQVLYNLGRRSLETGLLDWCRKRRVPIMAYSPLEQGRLPKSPALAKIAAAKGASPAQIMLAWAARFPDVMVIPKATNPAHLAENIAAMDVVLSDADIAALDAAHPAPKRATALDML